MARTVLGAFDRLLADQDVTGKQLIAIGLHVNGIADFLQSRYTMAERPFTMGSVARGTICRPERDIDILAPFSANEYWSHFQSDSRDFLYWVRNGLNDHYARTEVSSKQVAAVIDFSDTVADVVPAFRRKGGGYLIPSGRGGWRPTNPPSHATLIGESDRAHGGRLIPVIKLMKVWNFANGHHLRSFHVELMVERMWRDRTIPSWPQAVASTIQATPNWLRSTFADPWPDGGRVDEYLTDDERAQVIRMLEDDTKTSAQAEELRRGGREEAAFGRWSVVFRQTFPAFG